VTLISAVIGANSDNVVRWLKLHLPEDEFSGIIGSSYGDIELSTDLARPSEGVSAPPHASDDGPYGVHLKVEGLLWADGLEENPTTCLMDIFVSPLAETSTEMLFQIYPVNESLASSDDIELWPPFAALEDWRADVKAYAIQLLEWLRSLLVKMSLYFPVKVVAETWDWIGSFPGYFGQFGGETWPAQILPEVLAFPGRPPGRPGLTRKEIVVRVAAAIAAEELKQQHSRLTWKEVLDRLTNPPGIWPYGKSEADVKKLTDACSRLARLRESDPEALLNEAENYLRRKRMETP
jgi:hypothetical protein